MLNSSGGLGGGPVSSAASGVVGVSAANVMTSQQQQPTANNSVAPAMPPSAVGGSTSWAAAAGKGLPPQPEPTPNGAANKPIEVLNSLREALYSPVSYFFSLILVTGTRVYYKFSLIHSKPINIQWIRTVSHPCEKIMFSIVLHPAYY